MDEQIFKGEILKAIEKIVKFKDKFDGEEIKEIIDTTIKYPIELIDCVKINIDDSKQIYNVIISNIIDRIYSSKISFDELTEMKKWEFKNVSTNNKKKISNNIYPHFIKLLIDNYDLMNKIKSNISNETNLLINLNNQTNVSDKLENGVDDILDDKLDDNLDANSDSDYDSDNSEDSYDKTNDKDDNNDTNTIIDIFDDINSMSLPNFTKHQHQIQTIDKLVKTSFASGIIAMIMGAGKSFVLLNAIQKHWDLLKKNIEDKNFTYPIYLVCTDRTEILRSLFFTNITMKIKKNYLEKNKNSDNDKKTNPNIFDTAKFKKNYNESVDSFSEKNYVVSYQSEHYSWDLEKFAIWKKNDIVDMEEFVLVENFIGKDFNIDKINKSSKPVIYIVNNDFLKSGTKYKQIDKLKLKLVLNDECHGISGANNYQMLKYFRSIGCNVIGLSATPSREGKKAKQNLLDVYGLDPTNNSTNKLNIIYNYDMIQALEDGVVLPFYHIVVKPTLLNKKILLDSTNKEQVSLRTIIEQYIISNPELPYHKVIAWVKKISHIKTDGVYYSYIKDMLKDKYSIYRSYSGNDEASPIDEFGKFEAEDSNSILLCVNRGKEGSDIFHLDLGLFLDAVKSRSITVSLQTFGRVMRPDKEKKKKVGYIIECVKLDESKSVEMLSVKKVLNYYKMILNLSSLSESTEYYDKIIKLFANTEFDDKTKEITFKLGTIESKLKLDVEIRDWTKLKEFLGKEICKKLKLTKEQLFAKYIEIVKKQDGFDCPENNFTKLYQKLSHVELGLPKNIYKEFEEIWKVKTWYDVLGFKIYYSLTDQRNFIKSKYPHIKVLDKDSYNQIRAKFPKFLPKYPLDYYKTDLIYEYDQLLKPNKN